MTETLGLKKGPGSEPRPVQLVPGLPVGPTAVGGGRQQQLFYTDPQPPPSPRGVFISDLPGHAQLQLNQQSLLTTGQR
jgi:hypothetical protein